MQGRTRFRRLHRGQAQIVVEIVQAAGLDVVDAADREAGVDLIHGQRRRGEMTARRPARHDQPSLPDPMARPLTPQPAHRFGDLGDDRRKGRLRGERVAEEGDVHAVGERTRRHAGESLLGIALPVAAMDEGE